MSGSRKNFRYRFQVQQGSEDALLLEYLDSMGNAKNALVLDALRAYFLPYAYQDLGGKNKQQLKKLAQTMIWLMESRINQLWTQFGTDEKPSRLVPVPPLLSNSSSGRGHGNNPAGVKDEDEDEDEQLAPEIQAKLEEIASYNFDDLGGL